MVDVTPTSVLLEPGAPQWAQRFALRLARTFLNVFPTAPVRLWNAGAISNLPPAANWPGSVAVAGGIVWLSDGVSWHAVGGGFRGALVTFAADRIGVNYTPATRIAWDTKVYDTDNIFVPASGPTRLTVPAGVSRVRLAGAVSINNDTVGDVAYLTVDKNFVSGSSVPFAGMASLSVGSPATASRFVTSTGVVPVVPGDYFELRLNLTDTSVDLVNQATWFSMEIAA